MKIIFDGSNNWRVVELETNKNDDIDEDNLAKKILHGIESRILEKIMKGNYGVMITDNPDTDEYYTVELESNVYTAQDDTVMKRFNPLEYAYAGKMVGKTKLWNLVSKAKYWYTPVPEGEGDTTLGMKQVLMVYIKLEDISEKHKFSKGYSKKERKNIRSTKNKRGGYR